MEIVIQDRSTKVTKEMLELGEGIKTMLVAIDDALADGWQAGTDIPTILMASYQSLAKAIDNISQASVELKGEPTKAIMGALIPVSEGIEALLIKNDERQTDVAT